jgi:hypothetical protein
VFSDDRGKEDSLGNRHLNISHVQEQKQLLNQWVHLEDCKSGEVLLSAEFIPLATVQQSKLVEPVLSKEDLEQHEPKPKEIEVKIQDLKTVKSVVQVSESTKEHAQEVVSAKETKESVESSSPEPTTVEKEDVQEQHIRMVVSAAAVAAADTAPANVLADTQKKEHLVERINRARSASESNKKEISTKSDFDDAKTEGAVTIGEDMSTSTDAVEGVSVVKKESYSRGKTIMKKETSTKSDFDDAKTEGAVTIGEDMSTSTDAA